MMADEFNKRGISGAAGSSLQYVKPCLFLGEGHHRHWMAITIKWRINLLTGHMLRSFVPDTNVLCRQALWQPIMNIICAEAKTSADGIHAVLNG